MNPIGIVTLTCHPELFAALEGKLRDGSAFLGSKKQILRVAQDDMWEWKQECRRFMILSGNGSAGKGYLQ
jgi:hypothetical protein